MNGTGQADMLGTLAARLTDTQDRETYAELMSYLNSLPPGDELSRVAELFGFVTLLGERVPAALADAMTELRELAMTSADYHAQVEERLAKLPAEIIEGVKPDKIAKDMAESLRQQIVGMGLSGTVATLEKSAADIRALSDYISSKLAPLAENYTKIGGSIAGELEKLTAASRHIQLHDAQMAREQPGLSWIWQSALLAIMFLLGLLCGVVFEKGRTVNALEKISVQMERINTQSLMPVPNKLSRRK